jgi:dihydroorotate dehydrogenase (NAD+) catalytic subunit
MGGIMTGADALEFLIAGAKAVEVGTANFVDPDAPFRIVRELEEFCERRGVPRIEDVVGTLDLS